MATLTQLREPEKYRPCDWDLKADAAGRAYWTELFSWHVDAVVVPLIRAEWPDADDGRVEAARQECLARIADVGARPEAHARIDILYYTEVRRAVLEARGFIDPFRGVKARENDAALALWPDILTELEVAGPARRRELLTHGLMAGNIFDLGARATAHQHEAAAAFQRTRAKQPPHPWLRDDVDAWWARVERDSPYRQAVFFVDNAGGDVVLGCLPLARYLAERGTRMLLAANSGPALNDITAEELEPLVLRCAQQDGVLADALGDGRLSVIASGGVSPLLDLTALTDECVARAAGADLIMLHGMGRAVESNWPADFACDVLRTAVLKEDAVAQRLDGKVFDCVWRFERAQP